MELEYAIEVLNLKLNSTVDYREWKHKELRKGYTQSEIDRVFKSTFEQLDRKVDSLKKAIAILLREGA